MVCRNRRPAGIRRIDFETPHLTTTLFIGIPLLLHAVVPLSVITTATAGVPTPSVTFPKWKVVIPAGVYTGLFSARVKIPARAGSVGAVGVYLPKSNSAWGFFPGTTVGGRIQLTQP